MRSYDPEDEYDRKDLSRLNAEPWMVDLLKLNPEYIHWGPHEDYMCERDAGWRSPILNERWDGSGPFELDDLNEVVNFYFAVERESKACEACDSSGYNPPTKQIADDFYDFARTGRRWCDRITKDEALALREQGRLWDAIKDAPEDQLAAAINGAERNRRGLGHDAINRCILIEARAKRLSVWGYCETCKGHGDVFTEPEAHVELVLWLIHPRKGASRGVEIKRVERADLPAVFNFLAAAAKRNAERFEKVAALASAITPQSETAR